MSFFFLLVEASLKLVCWYHMKSCHYFSSTSSNEFSIYERRKSFRARSGYLGGRCCTWTILNFAKNCWWKVLRISPDLSWHYHFIILDLIKSFAIFWWVLVCSFYIMWPKSFKLWKVITVIDGVMVVGVLTCCAQCDLKAILMIIQWSLMQEPMLYLSELVWNYNAIIHLGCKNFDHQTRSGRPKTVDSEGMLYTRRVNLLSSTQRISGELGVSQSCVVHHLHNFTKILQNFWLILV